MANKKVVEKKNKKVLVSSVILLAILAEFLVGMLFGGYININNYKDTVYPNSYLGKYKISEIGFIYLSKRIEFFSDSILDNTITLVCNDKSYVYTYRDLNFTVDIDEIVNEIKSNQSSLNFNDKLKRIKGEDKKVYNYRLNYDINYITSVVESLKRDADVNVVYDNLVMDNQRNLSYVPGVEGYSLNVVESVQKIIEAVNSRADGNIEVELVGVKEEASKNSQYASIDAKTSSFSTTFDPYISRGTNLKVALNFIDGVILEPGEVFSFYEYAGPYDRDGYVFYYEFVGNGVCQIASTIYNTALLGGLEIVKRYPHAKKSVYVPGGLDATVASYSSGWYVDFQFKNTYDYPLYISAYATGGEAHVDFWSNHDAKKGKTYSTESVQIGDRGYASYLHVYENGVEVEKRFIDTTWYIED